MKVWELIETLQEIPDKDMDVVVSYNYGDFHNTHAASPIVDTFVALIKAEAYSRDGIGVTTEDPDAETIVDTDDEDAPPDEQQHEPLQLVPLDRLRTGISRGTERAKAFVISGYLEEGEQPYRR